MPYTPVSTALSTSSPGDPSHDLIVSCSPQGQGHYWNLSCHSFAGKTGESTVVIPELLPSVKEEDIQAQIPEARQVFIPVSQHTSRKKR